MKIPKKRCVFCHRWYAPNPRTWKHQLACPRKKCRKKRKAQADRSWRIKHPGRSNETWKLKVRAWARNYPDYWKQYRASHPEYVLRDNLRRVAAAKQVRAFRKTDAIRQISVDKIRSIREMGVECSAKTDAIIRRVDGIVDYLLWTVEKAVPQNTDGIGAPAPA